MARAVLIRPIVSEKANAMAEQAGKYTFVVDKKANKIVIKQAVEKMYSVTVLSVNTAVVPAKQRSPNTKSTKVKGYKPGYKKAVVTLTKGETIDIYGSNDEQE